MRAPGALVFFGTPEFAVPTLEILAAGPFRPALVVSQPSRRVGRGRALTAPPVAARAAELGLELAQPERVREPAFLERVEALEPWIAVVAAFGQIFRRRLLELPRAGCLNLHASLLPRWRGAAPIQAAIAAGDERTGVSTMWMERSLDSGPVLLARGLAIGPDEIAPELAGRLARAGAELVVETLERLAAGGLEATPQDENRVTYAPQLTRETGRVDWSLGARRLYDRWRAFQPWPGLWTEIAGERVAILACEPLAAPAGEGGGAKAPAERREGSEGPPGSVIEVSGERLVVACGDGRLGIQRARRPGRGEVRGDELARALGLGPGDRLG